MEKYNDKTSEKITEWYETTKGMWIIGISSVMFFVLFFSFIYIVSINNSESKLRNTISSKQLDNQNEYDNMWKKISQISQVTIEQKNALKEIFVEHARARNSGGGNSLIMKWVQESIPNIDTSTFNKLMNVIVSSRDSFTMRQKELISLNNEHKIMVDPNIFPTGLILSSIFGRKAIDITIILSDRTEDVFKTKKDNNINVFSGIKE